MHWETLVTLPAALVRRSGRFVVAELLMPHLVVSTSTVNGGQVDHLRFLVNHQSCEGSGHEALHRTMLQGGPEAYHVSVCAEVGQSAAESALMGTAANMNYAAVASEVDGDVTVTAVVTAGVQSNAVCAGDPASWRETRDGTVKVPAVAGMMVAGTINTILLVSRPVTASALARAVVTMTEGKSTALQRLAVPSCYSPELATGTGTDQFCLAAPLTGDHPLTSASSHMKFGELIGSTVCRATMEALRWQNGLEPSYTRGLFHALGRYGVKEATVFEDLTGLLDASDLELLRKNSKAAFYEPLVGAAAHAFGAVLDRVRHGTLPVSVAQDALVQQAATLAASLAAKPEHWPEFRRRLHATGSVEPKALLLSAIAFGWSEKWRVA